MHSPDPGGDSNSAKAGSQTGTSSEPPLPPPALLPPAELPPLAALLPPDELPPLAALLPPDELPPLAALPPPAELPPPDKAPPLLKPGEPPSSLGAPPSSLRSTAWVPPLSLPEARAPNNSSSVRPQPKRRAQRPAVDPQRSARRTCAAPRIGKAVLAPVLSLWFESRIRSFTPWISSVVHHHSPDARRSNEAEVSLLGPFFLRVRSTPIEAASLRGGGSRSSPPTPRFQALGLSPISLRA